MRELIPGLCSLVDGQVVVGGWRLKGLLCRLCTVLVVQGAPRAGLLVEHNPCVGMLCYAVLTGHPCSLNGTWLQVLETGRLVLEGEATGRCVFVLEEARTRLDLGGMIMVLRHGWPFHLLRLYPKALSVAGVRDRVDSVCLLG